MEVKEQLDLWKTSEEEIIKSCIPKDDDVNAMLHMYCCQRVSPSYKSWMLGADCELVERTFKMFKKFDEAFYEAAKKIMEENGD